MFTTGDLVWLPQKTVLLLQEPMQPQRIKVIEKPEVGLFVEQYNADFCTIVFEGEKWKTNRKHIKLMRKEYAS